MDSVGVPSDLTELEAKKKKTPGLKKAPSFGIQGTQCCGYHTVSGFQYTRDPDCEAFIIGIQQSYLLNAKNCTLQCAENSKAEQAHYANEATRNTRYNPPYPLVGNQPVKIAGMVVFTWNSKQYDPMAKKLAAFIKERSLGACSFSGKVVNPNSNNQIEAMTWLVDSPGYKKFVDERIGDYA